MRAIKTSEYLYIKNYEPDRWPAGTPNWEIAYIEGSWYGDVDNSPAKLYMIDNETEHQAEFDLAFAKRPAEELYALMSDPGQMTNLADVPAYTMVKQSLLASLESELISTQDPRALGAGGDFDTYTYYGGSPLFPGYEPE